MEYKRFGSRIVVRIDKGEEILTSIKELALKERIKLASIEGLGAVNDITVGVFDTKEKKFKPNYFQGDLEIVSLTGSINTMNQEFYSHLHMAVADASGNVFGGHLTKAVVSATCEMFVDVIDGVLDRYFDSDTGLNLFKFE